MKATLKKKNHLGFSLKLSFLITLKETPYEFEVLPLRITLFFVQNDKANKVIKDPPSFVKLGQLCQRNRFMTRHMKINIAKREKLMRVENKMGRHEPPHSYERNTCEHSLQVSRFNHNRFYVGEQFYERSFGKITGKMS